jgi:hypothetical protein
LERNPTPRPLKLFLLGALSFWGPEIFLCIWNRSQISPKVLTLLLPCCLLLGYFLVMRFRSTRGAEHPSRAIFMLLGVWMLGTLAILIAASFEGAGFRTGGIGSAVITALLGFLPPYTFIAATYDGSLLALIVVSVLMPLLHVVFERRGWVFPPT